MTKVEMNPIPYRHIKLTVLNWVVEQYPNLKGKITDINFSPDGLIVSYELRKRK